MTINNTHIKDFDTHRSVLTIDFGLPFVSLTCVDLEDGEEIGTVSLSEWQVEDTLGFEPDYTTDLDSVIEKLEHHIFG